MFCIKCGSNIKDDAKFCPVCGASQAAPQPQKQPEPQFAPPQPQFNQAPQFQYQKPATPTYGTPQQIGVALGAVGLALALMGLISAIIFLFDAIDTYDLYESYSIEFDPATSTWLNYISKLITPIFGISFASASRSKGFRNGITASGIVLGIIGTVLSFIAFIIIATI